MPVLRPKLEIETFVEISKDGVYHGIESFNNMETSAEFFDDWEAVVDTTIKNYCTQDGVLLINGEYDGVDEILSLADKFRDLADYIEEQLVNKTILVKEHGLDDRTISYSSYIKGDD